MNSNLPRAPHPNVLIPSPLCSIPCRRRGVLSDPLLPRMFPPDSPEGARARQLCCDALEQQRSALASDAYRPPLGRRLQPTADTPLAVRGVAMVREKIVMLQTSGKLHLEC